MFVFGAKDHPENPFFIVSTTINISFLRVALEREPFPSVVSSCEDTFGAEVDPFIHTHKTTQLFFVHLLSELGHRKLT